MKKKKIEKKIKRRKKREEEKKTKKIVASFSYFPTFFHTLDKLGVSLTLYVQRSKLKRI